MLVDVALVLLLIFMVTAPLLTMAVDVKLPDVTTAAPATPSTVVITLGKEGSIAIEGRVLSLEDAVERARQIHAAGEGAVYLRADKDVPYGLVMSVLDGLRRAGMDDASLVVQPLPDVSFTPAPHPARPSHRR